MAYRNTQYEEEKIKQLAESCPKLRISLEKPDKYILTGCPEDNDAPAKTKGAGRG